MDVIEPRLSSRAQEFWPKSLVICRNQGTGAEQWTLHRHGQGVVPIGDSFDSAASALRELARGERRA